MIIDKTDNFSIKFILRIILFFSIFFSGFYLNRGVLYFYSSYFSYPLTTNLLFFTIAFTVLFMEFFLLGFIRFVYIISMKIYMNLNLRKLLMGNTVSIKLMSEYPLSYNIYYIKLISYIIFYNIVMGIIRLLYISRPYLQDFVEAIAPPLINFLMMLLFFYDLKKKFIEEIHVKNVFISLAVPYALVLLILM